MTTEEYDFNGPPFDEDDLINDYCQEENEDYFHDPIRAPTPPFEDDLDVAQEISNNPLHERQTQDHIIIPQEYESEDIPMTVVLSQTSVQNVHQKSGNRSKDPYDDWDSWTGKRKWRDADQSGRKNDGIMESSSWKAKRNVHEGKMGQSTNMTSVSSDVQLVRSLHAQFHQRLFTADDLQLLNERRSRKNQNRYVHRFSDIFVPQEEIRIVPMVLGDGKMVTIIRNKLDDSSETMNYMKSSFKGNLLGCHMDVLIRRVEVLERRAFKRNNNKGNAMVRQDFDDSPSFMRDFDNEKKDQVYVSTEDAEMSKMENVGDVECVEVKRNQASHVRDTPPQLWVDKHAPTHFSDLLSDEKTNREVLRALREWDPFVFRKRAPPRPAIFQKGQDIPTSHTISDISDNVVANMDHPDENEKNSETLLNASVKDLRPSPENRVILLSGPPGVGKTTLAHIIAKHAGYRPVEVNASDERSASILKERVLRAMESTTLNVRTKGNSRSPIDRISNGNVPNCLILDEIDGADAQSSISSLVEIIRAEILPRSSNKNAKPYLRRPIIFICNHKFTPALRPLLPYSKQFDVSPPSSERLVGRLRSVLSSEGIVVNGGSAILHNLVAAAGGDIRSCLYSLQFAAARAREISLRRRQKCVDEHVTTHYDRGDIIDISPVLQAALDGDGRGMKDDRNDVVSTLYCIFRKQKHKNDKSTVRFSRDIDRVLSLIDSFGDNSKILDSMFTNVAQIPYVDPLFDRCYSALEWLSYADLMRSYKTNSSMINSAEHQHIQKIHIPPSACAVHVLCRIETRPQLNFSSRVMLDSAYRTEANLGLIGRFLEGLKPQLRCGFNLVGCVLELLPYSLRLLSTCEVNPALNRAVSSIDMLTDNERLAFNYHVSLLRSLGLTYVRDEEDKRFKNSAGDVQFRLEPDIDFARFFKGSEVPPKISRVGIPSSLKQLLAHAAHLEEVRDRSIISEKEESKGIARGAPEFSMRYALMDVRKQSRGKVDVPVTAQTESTCKTDRSQHFLGEFAEKVKAAKLKRKAVLIGLDQSKSTIKFSNTGSGIPMDAVIKFKYQKGFTQAVRMPCCETDIL